MHGSFCLSCLILNVSQSVFTYTELQNCMECTIDSNSTLDNKLLSIFVNFFRLLSKFKPLQHILLLYLLWMDILTIYPHATLLPICWIHFMRSNFKVLHILQCINQKSLVFDSPSTHTKNGAVATL